MQKILLVLISLILLASQAHAVYIRYDLSFPGILLGHPAYKLNGNPGVEFFRTLATASAKHQEVLTSLLPRVPVDVRQTLVTVINFPVRNLASVQEFEK